MFYDDETKVCSECGDEIHWDDFELDGEPICRDCYWKMLEPTFTFENALKVGERNKVTVEFNGFIWDLVGRNINEVYDSIKRDWLDAINEKTTVEDYAQAEFGFDWEDEVYQANREEKKHELPFAKETYENLERMITEWKK